MQTLKLGKFTRVVTIRRVDVLVHWSVFAIVAIILLASLKRPLPIIVALACYLGVLLIHECGHMIAAQRLGCRVRCIKIYPIHGLCYFDTPWSRFDRCVIAWGGVLAQVIVALPVIVWLELFGFTHIGVINAILAIFGPFSLFIAALNLIPAGGLDGATAWGLIPEWLKRVRSRSNKSLPKRTTDWRTY
jgi:hypothetical protein